MKVPHPSAREKSRETLLKETIFGIVILLLGAALLLVPMVLLGEAPGRWLSFAGIGCLVLSAFTLNRKIVIELIHELRDALPFLSDNPEHPAHPEDESEA